MSFDALKNVYNNIRKELDRVLSTLEQNSQSVELNKAIEAVYNKVVELKRTTDNTLSELDKNAEWDVLTIAFYGETNAGKSTIIETLRIILGEITKQEQQQKFRKICMDLNLVQEWQDAIKKEQAKASDNLMSLRIELLAAKVKKDKLSNEKIENALKEYQDGAIIGDGRSDFTREISRYKFDVNGNRFTLLDVPGIEGKESEVQEAIMQAVREAHAVFYVTRDPRLPQKGDQRMEEEEGTLEKIKKHLQMQAEVFTIYNKVINTAEELTSELVNQGEKDSLKVLEAGMREQLGSNYAGTFNVSAYPALVASTDNFLIKKMKNSRYKFLEVMGSAEIIRKTGMQSLAEKISIDMPKDTKDKILKSNFKKANEQILFLKTEVSNLINIFGSLAIKLKREADDSIYQLEVAQNVLSNGIDNCIENTIRKKFTKIRGDCYKKIDSDVSNSKFKRYLEWEIKNSIKTIQIDLQGQIKKELENFEQSFNKINKQHKCHIQKYIDDMERASGFDSKIEVKIDNGINNAGLIGAAVGAISLIATGGWIFVVGAIGVVVSFTKSIWGFFDKKYKIAQQKREVDRNVDKISKEFKLKYRKTREEIIINIENHLNNAKNNFQIPNIETEKTVFILKGVKHELERISQKTMKEGNLS